MVTARNARFVQHGGAPDQLDLDTDQPDVTDTELAAVNIIRDEFHPDWHYTIHPTQKGAH